ncbi:hypothetical protein [Spiroplasma endosymbiont of Labia minor]|uniref:hypothetical protein n=1 Tax=Spiroplasma endosymbiont of Labia minor TaxID=3066305 RepID=UPI0030D2DE01
MFMTLAIISWILILIGGLIQAFFGVCGLLPEIAQYVPKQITDFMNTQYLGSADLNNSVVNGDPIIASYIVPILLLVFSVIVIILAIIEFSRLRKRQKISKPLVKLILVAIIVASLIYGLGEVLILAIFCLIALVLLEVILFDTEALNNYAEERNLITIYREERKFEREISKEGKVRWGRGTGFTNSKKYAGPKWESKHKW